MNKEWLKQNTVITLARRAQTQVVWVYVHRKMFWTPIRENPQMQYSNVQGHSL